uniref:Uncharacterized protein n=1 Tax=Meloidogyne incognita TaxID=6306 RepID=A0A914NWP0_MELIC
MRNVTKRPRIGLFAGDSCSRPKEAISQSLRFLDAVGFHDPTECLLNNKEALRKRSEVPRHCCSLTKGFRISQFCCPST